MDNLTQNNPPQPYDLLKLREFFKIVHKMKIICAVTSVFLVFNLLLTTIFFGLLKPAMPDDQSAAGIMEQTFSILLIFLWLLFLTVHMLPLVTSANAAIKAKYCCPSEVNSLWFIFGLTFFLPIAGYLYGFYKGNLLAKQTDQLLTKGVQNPHTFPLEKSGS